MKTISTKLEGKEFALIELEDQLKPLGFVIGGNWDYDHGMFDYQLAVDDGYYYLRVPFHAIEGELDRDGAVVQIDTPFVLHHKYKEGADQDVDMSTFNAAINQFQEPTDEDAKIADKYETAGRELVNEIEEILNVH